jgi:hypothetical protein
MSPALKSFKKALVVGKCAAGVRELWLKGRTPAGLPRYLNAVSFLKYSIQVSYAS